MPWKFKLHAEIGEPVGRRLKWAAGIAEHTHAADTVIHASGFSIESQPSLIGRARWLFGVQSDFKHQRLLCHGEDPIFGRDLVAENQDDSWTWMIGCTNDKVGQVVRTREPLCGQGQAM